MLANQVNTSLPNCVSDHRSLVMQPQLPWTSPPAIVRLKIIKPKSQEPWVFTQSANSGGIAQSGAWPSLRKRSRMIKKHEQVEVSEQDRAWPKIYGGNKNTGGAGGDGGFEISTDFVAEVKKAKKDRHDDGEGDRLDAHDSAYAPAEVERHFRQPLVIDPGMTGDRPGKHVETRKLVMGQKVLGVSEVPPDIRIIHPAAGERENDNDDDGGEHDLERKYGKQAPARAEEGPRRRVFRSRGRAPPRWLLLQALGNHLWMNETSHRSLGNWGAKKKRGHRQCRGTGKLNKPDM